MKKYLVVCLAVAALVVTGGLVSEVEAMSHRGGGHGIVGSSHDFSDDLVSDTSKANAKATNEWAGDSTATAAGSGWNYRGEICRVCHAPHDKNRTAWKEWGTTNNVSVTTFDASGVGTTTLETFQANGLLWNHTISDTPAYPMYKSDSMAGQIAGTVLGRSKLCLSCHDGTVALNAFDGNQGKALDNGTFTVANGTKAGTAVVISDYASGYLIGPNSNNGTDFLMGTHPISVAYDAGFFPENPKVGMDGGLHVPTGKTFGNDVIMASAPTVDMVLEQGMVQCHSCHDVHDSTGVVAVGTRLNRAGQGRAENRGSDPSGLCLSCHNK